MGEMTISEYGGLSYGPEMRLSDSSFLFYCPQFLDVVLPISNCGSLLGLDPSKGIWNPGESWCKAFNQIWGGNRVIMF